jgi:hypothetical protein
VIEVFADTLYWIALTNPDDCRYRDALEMDDRLRGAKIVTTDEVLVEFMTFFSVDPWRRLRAATTVRRLLVNPKIASFRRAGIRFSRAWISMKHAPTKATV